MVSQALFSSPCSCPVVVGSTASPTVRPCRLGQPQSTPWQRCAPATQQPVLGWFQRQGVRTPFSSQTSPVAHVPRGGLASTSVSVRNSHVSGIAPPAGCSVPPSAAYGAHGRRWGYAPTLSRCCAVGSPAADMGVSGAGPPSTSQDPPDATAGPGPLQPPSHPQPDPQHDAPSPFAASNGHPPSAAVSWAAADDATAAAGAGRPPEAVRAARAAPPPDMDPGATSVDGLDDTRKFVFADEWGFTQVGGDLPEGTTPATFSDMFPERLFAFDPVRAVLAVAVPLAAMAAGYGWLWYMHSICPVWQQLACAALIGTAYTGLFKVAHECAAFSFLPQSPRLQDALGLVLMLPSLYPYTSWRLHYMHHLAHLNMLWEDTFGWHPFTKLQLATEVLCGDRLRLALRRLALATPLKLFASVGHWLRSFDDLDLKRFHPETYGAVVVGWAGPILFLGFGVPAIIAAFGISGLVSGYLLPWLVFHFWLSTLSLLQHSAPHIPFRTEGEGYDSGRAAVCGTVTVRLPRPLEVLLNDANYMLPQLVAPGLPCFHAREAYECMRMRLLPYLTEATLSVKLLTNHITKWQVYDEEQETYLPMEEVQQSLEADIETLMAEAERAEAERATAGQGQAQASTATVEAGAASQEANGPGPAFA